MNKFLLVCMAFRFSPTLNSFKLDNTRTIQVLSVLF